MNMKKILLLFALLVAFATRAFAIAETVRMSVGETRKLAPSVLPTQVLAGQPAWTSSRPYDVEIVSTDMYTCTIKARRSFSGYALVHCLYYYRRLDPSGHYIGQGSGYVDYHVFVSGGDDGDGDDGGTGGDGGVLPKSIRIEPTEITLQFGGVYTMEVYIDPPEADQTVTWSSTNKSVASVSRGNVLGANGVGTATVTATTVNGRSASCYVTVEPYNPPEPTRVSLPSTVELRVGETIKLTPVFTPSNAIAGCAWLSDDPSIATVSGGVVTAISPGFTKVNVYAGDTPELRAACVVAVIGDSVLPPSDSEEMKKKRTKARINELVVRMMLDLDY